MALLKLLEENEDNANISLQKDWKDILSDEGCLIYLLVCPL